MTESVFPPWVIDTLDTFKRPETYANTDIVERFVVEFSELTEYLGKAPDKITYFELAEITPEATTRVFGNPLTGLLHAAESVTLGWAYSHTYKLRCYCNGLLDALDKQNLLLAAASARGIFEHVAFFHYFYIRIDATFTKGHKLAQMQRKRVAKGKKPPASWINSVIENLLKHVQLCLRATQATDFDWQSFLEDIVTPEHLEALRHDNPDVAAKERWKRVHMNDCVRELQRIDKDYDKYYSALSEFVHPNRGSHWMVLDLRETSDGTRFDTTLTDRPANNDAIFVLMSAMAMALERLLPMTRKELQHAHKMASAYQKMAIDAVQNAAGTRH